MYRPGTSSGSPMHIPCPETNVMARSSITACAILSSPSFVFSRGSLYSMTLLLILDLSELKSMAALPPLFLMETLLAEPSTPVLFTSWMLRATTLPTCFVVSSSISKEKMFLPYVSFMIAFCSSTRFLRTTCPWMMANENLSRLASVVINSQSSSPACSRRTFSPPKFPMFESLMVASPSLAQPWRIFLINAFLSSFS